MNETLRGILAKHSGNLFPPPCPRCGGHGATTACPFPSDEEIVAALVGGIVADFPTSSAHRLIRLLSLEGPTIALELHELLNAPSTGD